MCLARISQKELARFFPAYSGGGDFRITANTIFVLETVPGVEGKLVVDSCMWSLKRLSSERPTIEFRPEPQ